jgi:hypothetical protein
LLSGYVSLIVSLNGDLFGYIGLECATKRLDNLGGCVTTMYFIRMVPDVNALGSSLHAWTVRIGQLSYSGIQLWISMHSAGPISVVLCFDH